MIAREDLETLELVTPPYPQPAPGARVIWPEPKQSHPPIGWERLDALLAQLRFES